MNSLQGSAAVGDKIEVLLSHVVALEDFFDSRPGDVAEQRRRDELIEYVVVPPFELGSECLLASLNGYENNWGRFAGRQGCSNLEITFETMKIYSEFSRIYKRQYSTIRFVRDLKIF